MKILKSLIYFVLLLGVMACSLEEKPEHFVDSEHFYQTKAQCRSILNSCYNKLNSIFNYRMFYMTEIQSDLWWNNSSDYDATLAITPSSPAHGETVWVNCYAAIMYCNECIECIAASPLDKQVKDPMVAEARVLRAFYYHILTQVFGGVPFYLERVDSKEKMEQIRSLPRTEPAEIRRVLYDDLKTGAIPCFTYENGLIKRPSEVEENRAGYALGLYLMANFAMWNGEYESALVPLEQLETLYGQLTEDNYPLENIKWSIKNTPESIFELQHDYNVTGVQYYGNLARFTTPAWDKGRIYDGVDLTENGFYAVFEENMATSTPARASSRLAKYGNENALFSAIPLKKVDGVCMIDMDAVRSGKVGEETIDKRVYYTLGLGNLLTGDTFTEVGKGSFIWSGPKFWCPDMKQGYDSNNYKIYRYADAVLMMAECHCRLDDPETAQKYLNYTRVRAGLDPISNYTGNDDLMNQIRDERARELAGEFHRKFDLVRWGLWYDMTSKYSQKGTLKGNIMEYHEYYPIPDTECALSGYILKNEAYSN